MLSLFHMSAFWVVIRVPQVSRNSSFLLSVRILSNKNTVCIVLLLVRSSRASKSAPSFPIRFPCRYKSYSVVFRLIAWLSASHPRSVI